MQSIDQRPRSLDVCELSQRVDGKDADVQVLVRADMDEVFRQHLPDTSPDESDSCHVEVSNFHKSLQRELAWVHCVIELVS